MKHKQMARFTIEIVTEPLENRQIYALRLTGSKARKGARDYSGRPIDIVIGYPTSLEPALFRH